MQEVDGTGVVYVQPLDDAVQEEEQDFLRTASGGGATADGRPQHLGTGGRGGREENGTVFLLKMLFLSV